MSKKFVQVSVLDVLEYWACGNDECKKFHQPDVVVNPCWYQDNGTPVCDKCDTDMVFHHVEVRK